MANQTIQSLFQVLYLGSTVVDRHCSHAVMLWITEELKLRTNQRILTWLTSGDTGVSYVADSGMELFGHPHSTILRCATGTDGITFSYIVRGDEGQYTCHVFQCLTPDEAAQVMKKFKENARGDSVTTHSPTNLPPPTSHAVHYVGSVEIDSSYSTQSGDLLDNVLEKFHKRLRKLSRKEVSLPQLKKFAYQEEGSSGDSMEILNPSKSTAVSDSTGYGPGTCTAQELSNISGTTEMAYTSSEVPKPVETSLDSNAERSPDGDSQSISSQSIPSLTDRQMHMTKEDSCDVSIILTRTTPERMFSDEGDVGVGDVREGGGREGGAEVDEEVDSGDFGTKNAPPQLKNEDGEQSWQNFEPTSPSVSTLGSSDVPFLDPEGQVPYNSDIDEYLSDSHTNGSSTSCTTPDPAVGDLTPSGTITPVHFDSKVFHEQKLNMEQEDLPSSCPPQEPLHTTEETSDPFRDEVDGKPGKEEVDEGMDYGREGSTELGCDDGIVSISMKSSFSANIIPDKCKLGRGGSKAKVEHRKVVGRSHSFERPQTQQSKNGVTEDKEGTGIVYDTLPELQSLKQSPVFLALGRKSRSWVAGERGDKRGREVRLVISPNMVQVVRAQTSKVILRRTIRSIACCAQSEKRPEFVGFVCREGQAKTFICHIFKAASLAMATAVMDSFKSSFVQALNSSPTTMCDTCPLQQLHSLCQNLEGVPTPVAQSRIQECLSQLSEADYNCIMSEYKLSEHADHEFTQLVVLVSLIREHLQKKQQEHIHPIHNVLDVSGTHHHHQPPRPPRLSKLERAKLALANSFDNLRKGTRTTEKRQRQFGKSLTTEETSVPPLATENRRASLDPKLAKKERAAGEKGPGLERSSSARRATGVSSVKDSGDSSGGEEGRGRSRTGSWLLRFRGPKPVSSSQEDVSENERQKTDREESKRETSPTASPLLQEQKRIKPAQKLERFDSKEDLVSKPSSDPLAQAPLNIAVSTSPPPPSTPPPSEQREGTIFKTPTRTPMWRKQNMLAQKAHTKAVFSPLPTDVSSPAYKYRREHKRSGSMSWRHEIFESVTPVKERSTEKSCAFQDWEIIEPTSFDQLGGSATVCSMVVGGGGDGEEEQRGSGSPRTMARERWRRSIEQQIMLLRMEKENQSILKASTEADTKRLKLCYKDPSIQADNVGRKWAELLSRPFPPEQSELRSVLLEGVIPGRRGEVWSLLIQSYQDKHPSLPHSPPITHSLTLSQLCQRRTEYENAIMMDLGRTFPSHPYFSTVEQRGGQRALANILHAYAVSDEETGYCQGLSFIAGMILIHTKDEESAYKMLCQLMQVYSYRDVYCHDLSVLQLRLYQLSRLLHDVLPTLHSHLGTHEITPFYYAAPWFLTLFSSQYPIAFVARVMDLFFLDGPDIVFKVAVALLRYYEARILRCSTMESISEFLKEGMPQLVLNNMTTILEDALNMELGSKLQSFETEYFVLEELTTSFNVEAEAQDLKTLNDIFRSHNKELIEQLAFCRGMISNLENTVATLQETVREQELRMSRLEAAQALSSPSPEDRNSPPT